ncbi:acyl-CoA thioesterase [Desertihabitans brevis]|uniref:Acyl-CoA thioesterase n=1 Tax=Desertihabitans brevis TaxID=2268447 RepID=A0A367YU44_9ACTN|nr:thioesterase family protein [Desertihabitans brevis]RCK69049.1 acyl-CoA thioesterase [Desertihabitans brevis]
MLHVYRCPLRWGDMDAQAHVNNGAFVDYLQEARVDFLTRSEVAGMLGRADGTAPASHGVLVVRTQVELLRPLIWSTEELEVRMDLHAVGGARFTLGYELGPADAPVARARTLLAPYDLAGGRVLRLTPEQRAFFRAREVPAEPWPQLAGADRPGLAVPLRVRWSDLDSYGHVNNVRFFDYAQEARIRLLQQVLAGTPDGAGQWLVVRQDVDHRAQLGYRSEPYEASVAVAALGRTSMTLRTLVRDPQDGTLFAEVRTVAVCADERGRPVPLPDTVRSALEHV